MYDVKRRWKITKEDIEKYGPTPGCLGCRTLKAGLTRQTHNENCRKRIEDKIMRTAEGRARIERSDTRINEQIAQQLEQEDREMVDKKRVSSKSHLQDPAVQRARDKVRDKALKKKIL